MNPCYLCPTSTALPNFALHYHYALLSKLSQPVSTCTVSACLSLPAIARLHLHSFVDSQLSLSLIPCPIWSTACSSAGKIARRCNIIAASASVLSPTPELEQAALARTVSHVTASTRYAANLVLAPKHLLTLQAMFMRNRAHMCNYCSTIDEALATHVLLMRSCVLTKLPQGTTSDIMNLSPNFAVSMKAVVNQTGLSYL